MKPTDGLPPEEIERRVRQSIRDRNKRARTTAQAERLRKRITKARYDEDLEAIAHWVENSPGEWFRQVEARSDALQKEQEVDHGS